MFDNTTSHFDYIMNKLHIKDMNKNLEGKQPYLYNNLYIENDIDKRHFINIQEFNKN